jgi:DNA-binding transcriptional ArsR family regulator
LFPLGGPLAIVRVVVNNAFGALANPIRRGIVERLASGPRTVAAATSGFAVSKPAISRHVRVLEAAGVVERDVRGRTHQLRLNVAALNEAADWLDRQRLVWDRMFDAVEDHLGVPGSGSLGGRPAGDSNGGRR